MDPLVLKIWRNKGVPKRPSGIDLGGTRGFQGGYGLIFDNLSNKMLFFEEIPYCLTIKHSSSAPDQPIRCARATARGNRSFVWQKHIRPRAIEILVRVRLLLNSGRLDFLGQFLVFFSWSVLVFFSRKL